MNGDEFIVRQQDLGKPHSARDRRIAIQRLSRAFLNRSHEALHTGQPELARTCLARTGPSSSAKVIRTLATDPRLCVQMTTLATKPSLAQRWFARNR